MIGFGVHVFLFGKEKVGSSCFECIRYSLKVNMTHVGFLFVDILLMILGDVELNQGTRNKTLQHVYR